MMPSSVAPTRLSQRLGVGQPRGRRRQPDRSRLAADSVRANASSSSRRSSQRLLDQRRAVSDRPAGRTRSAAPASPQPDVWTRLAAGWMRCSRASNENALPSAERRSRRRARTRSALSARDGRDELGKIARQRLAGFRLQLDLAAVAEHQAAEAVPFRLVLPVRRRSESRRPSGRPSAERAGGSGAPCLIASCLITQTAGISAGRRTQICRGVRRRRQPARTPATRRR